MDILALTYYLIPIIIAICYADIFKKELWTKELENVVPVCKLRTLDDVIGEIQCGKKCTTEIDACCVYFSYDFMSKRCYLCTAETISPGTSLEYVSNRTERNFQHIFLKSNMCDSMGICNPKDCSDYRSQGHHISGIYTISPSPGQPFKVYCDMATAGGGWTVFQRRMDGSENFYRTWNEYESGFGNMSREFWLGNANLSAVTSQRTYQMRIDMSDFDWTNIYVLYNNFTVNQNDYYRMDYSSFKGNAGDSLHRSKGRRFTTQDRDLDESASNCAITYKGAWWYSACHDSNLNGLYLSGTTSQFATGIVWHSFRGKYYSLRLTEMKLRPSNYVPPYTLNAMEKDLQAPKDCAEHRERGITASGVYSVTTRGRKPMTFDVYCDMTISGGGWTVFQRRADGSQDFQKNWVQFQNGFGNLSNEFWLGNEKIADFTDQGSYELRVDLEDFDGDKRFAFYDFFTINRENKYRLLLGSYNGDAGDTIPEFNGDAMAYHNGSKWSTYDSDNDNTGSHHCANLYKGAWWHNACHHANLNGLYLAGPHSTYANGVNWHPFKGHSYSLKITEMKIRPAGYEPPS